MQNDPLGLKNSEKCTKTLLEVTNKFSKLDRDKIYIPMSTSI